MIFSDKERQAPTKVSETEPSHLARYNFALQFIKNTNKVLYMPCGSGYGSKILSSKAHRVIGIDISLKAIRHAKKFFQEKNTTFLVADMQKIGDITSDNSKFDIIVSFEGIEHIKYQKSFLINIKNLLKTDGYFIISTPRKPHGSPHHTIEFSQKEFIDILSNNFIIEKMFGQIYTDIFDMKDRNEDPDAYKRFNFIALCKSKGN